MNISNFLNWPQTKTKWKLQNIQKGYVRMPQVNKIKKIQFSLNCKNLTKMTSQADGNEEAQMIITAILQVIIYSNIYILDHSTCDPAVTSAERSSIFIFYVLMFVCMSRFATSKNRHRKVEVWKREEVTTLFYFLRTMFYHFKPCCS